MASASATASGHGRKAPPGKEEEGRTILLNAQQQEKFPNNYISTGKYSILTFIPLFLYEQFRRYSNLFFLLIGLLQQIPNVSPTGRFTTIVPFCCILCVSALKEMLEDFKRHKADKEINNREVEVYHTSQQGSSQWHLVKWKDIRVGDFAKVIDGSFFPADLVLFGSSDPEGICYIETANLDGETNLKVRQAIPETAKLNQEELPKLAGHLKCELPNRHLYEFAGKLNLKARDLALGQDQILLRGSKLQNTGFILGIVVYTGHETKLMKNSTKVPLKRSTVDKQTNMQIIMLFFMLILIALVSSLMSTFYVDTSKHWYIRPLSADNPGKHVEFGLSFLTFFILYNNLIPISLTVTLEVVRFIQALFINWDIDMYCEESDTPALARTSNLNEELGQVRYVFSDKTGTLTRNIMEFKACSVGGKLYPPESFSNGRNLLVDNLLKGDPTATEIREFLILLAVCHTVIPDYTKEEVIYHASSPDERALVLGAKDMGYVFESRTPKTVEITALNKRETYEILNTLEFTSSRKRMSVIVRTPEGKIKLFSKGADSMIYDLLEGGASKSGDHTRVSTMEHLEEFSRQGLRTLCCAVVEIPSDVYAAWQVRFHKASTAINEREQKLEEVAGMIEKNLKLLGATAIEDKLQDQVPETIAALLTAGIHVWVLTGDKQETAINIGHSCRLLKQSMDLLIINCDTLEDTKKQIVIHTHGLSVNNKGSLPVVNDAAVIIDGKSLKYALMDEARKDFLVLCCSCKAVICCRASPLQKAEIVEYVTHHTKKVTLAIGDGANDVAMIQKAHVGIGISGQEGLQAACASDYTIAQFRFLQKLLFVHGAWNYDRMCKLIFYSYYKNICLYLIELWFAIYSAWTGQVIFDRWTIGLYNMLFTCGQPICMGVFDRNCSDKLRLKYPILYFPTKSPFSLWIFFSWILNSVIHSIILFWLPFYIFQDGIVWGDGSEGGYLVLGNFIYTYVVVVVSLKSGLETRSWTLFTHLSVWGSIALWLAFLGVYSYIYRIGRMSLGVNIYGIAWMVYSSPVFWAGLIVVPIATLLPDMILKVRTTTIKPTIEERYRQCDIRKKDPSQFFKKGKKVTKGKGKRKEVENPSESSSSTFYSSTTTTTASSTVTLDTSQSGQSEMKKWTIRKPRPKREDPDNNKADNVSESGASYSTLTLEQQEKESADQDSKTTKPRLLKKLKGRASGIARPKSMDFTTAERAEAETAEKDPKTTPDSKPHPAVKKIKATAGTAPPDASTDAAGPPSTAEQQEDKTPHPAVKKIKVTTGTAPPDASTNAAGPPSTAEQQEEKTPESKSRPGLKKTKVEAPPNEASEATGESSTGKATEQPKKKPSASKSRKSAAKEKPRFQLF